MKQYLAYLTQDGGGCDYTIACGKKLITIEAETMDEAQEKLEEEIRECYSGREYRLELVELYEVASERLIDIQNIYAKIDGIREESRLDAIKQSELAQLEQLKKKYEKH